LLLVLAAGTVAVSLARQLPGQNILSALVIIGGMGAAAHSIGARTGIPFGPFLYASDMGAELWPGLPWAMPVVWMTVVLTARGVGRLILRPWRRSPTYGLRLIALTVALVVLFDLGLEPFAASVRHYWLWQPSNSILHWHGAPWVNFLGWGIITLLILAFVTPFLIQKRPGTPPPDYFPLLTWVLLHALMINGAVAHRLWDAAALTVLQVLGVSFFASRGARW
jgi:uncharacterized membrane protein